MNAIESDEQWLVAFLDTPFATPKAPTELEAMRTPGCYVISNELTADKKWPRYWGRVAKYSDNKVVVHSTDNYHRDHPRTVWIGDSAQFFRMWHCD